MGTLEAGRMYVDKRGRDVGPMEKRQHLTYSFEGQFSGSGYATYTEDGTFFTEGPCSDDIDFHESEKRFPKEKVMKFHDKMHVRLRNGIEIKGLPFVGGNPRLDNMYWHASGCVSLASDDFDIVEVLSTPPPLKVKDVELKAGMIVHVPGGSQKVYKVMAICDGRAWLQREDYNGIYLIKDISECVVEDV